jgi:hypothetical protein
VASLVKVTRAWVRPWAVGATAGGEVGGGGPGGAGGVGRAAEASNRGGV